MQREKHGSDGRCNPKTRALGKHTHQIETSNGGVGLDPAFGPGANPGCRNTSISPSQKVLFCARDWGADTESTLRVPVEILRQKYPDSL